MISISSALATTAQPDRIHDDEQHDQPDDRDHRHAGGANEGGHGDHAVHQRLDVEDVAHDGFVPQSRDHRIQVAGRGELDV